MESITLYFREGPSDKVYQASIRSHTDGYTVDFAYGRRGSTLTTGTKSPQPVELDVAKSIFDKLVKEKLAKGYKPGDTGTGYSHNGTKQNSGVHCQLLNPVPENRLEELICDSDHWMQEKFDGRRLLLKKDGANVIGINRLGQVVAIPQTLAESAAQYRGDFLIDGEAVGEKLHAFDLLSISSEDLRCCRYAVRYFRLRDLLDAFVHPHIQLVEAFCDPRKQERFQQFQADGSEGVVFKHVDASYTAGRPNSGGAQLKHKFYETASFVVTKSNEKRSVSLILFDGDKVCSAGNVTIPPNHEIPSPGTVIECRYLYAFKESGCIYQPVFLGARDDIRAEECITGQLKFKPSLVPA